MVHVHIYCYDARRPWLDVKEVDTPSIGGMIASLNLLLHYLSIGDKYTTLTVKSYDENTHKELMANRDEITKGIETDVRFKFKRLAKFKSVLTNDEKQTVTT